jgi:hypothetical protein
LGCHALYYALLFSAVHEGMMTLLVCLSSYIFPLSGNKMPQPLAMGCQERFR